MSFLLKHGEVVHELFLQGAQRRQLLCGKAAEELTLGGGNGLLQFSLELQALFCAKQQMAPLIPWQRSARMYPFSRSRLAMLERVAMEYPKARWMSVRDTPRPLCRRIYSRMLAWTAVMPLGARQRLSCCST